MRKHSSLDCHWMNCIEIHIRGSVLFEMNRLCRSVTACEITLRWRQFWRPRSLIIRFTEHAPGKRYDQRSLSTTCYDTYTRTSSHYGTKKSMEEVFFGRLDKKRLRLTAIDENERGSGEGRRAHGGKHRNDLEKYLPRGKKKACSSFLILYTQHCWIWENRRRRA